MSAPATPKQVSAIRAIVGNRSGIKPWHLSDEKAVEFLNDYLRIDLDPSRLLDQQLDLDQASNIISRLNA